MGRSIIICAMFLAASAVAGPPRGLRTKQTVPTHVVLTKATLKSGTRAVTVHAGTQVRAAAPSLRPLRGKIAVTTIGSVSVKGTLDAKRLGLVVQSDTELRTVDGKAKLGKAHAGGMVRVLPGPAKKGYVLVETVGDVVAKALIKKTALSPSKRELVLTGDYKLVALGAVKLMKDASPGGPTLATVSPYAKLTPLDHKATYRKVRTFGAFAIEGYIDMGDLVPRAEIKPRPSEPSLLNPTHEVFVRTSLYAQPTVRRFGFVRGGTLVERAAGTPTKDMVRVHTLGETEVSGWVRLTDLRALEQSVWQDKKP